MKNEDFRYVLRYNIDPEFNFSDRIKELVDFCAQGRIEEVMLFDFPEELSPGHPTLDDLTSFVKSAKNIKEFLAKIGIDVSLNPWSSTYGITRGRHLRPGQNFNLMVGENGIENSICVCPLCQNWQNYISEAYSYLAKEITPIAIWIEDDWRLHNHDLYLGWGGCFCDRHLELFSERIGRVVGREELLGNILKTGEVHPWRGIWLDISKETMLEPARKIRDAIKEASPCTKIGLMSSVPDAHSVEARDWHLLQEAFCGDDVFLSRPHVPCYTENHPLQNPASVTRCTVANLREPFQVYPELEGSPRSGAYSKSAKFGMWRIMESALYGSDGITINHFDVMGNGTLYHKDYYKYLADTKPIVNALSSLDVHEANSIGINVLFSPEVSSALQTTDSDSMGSLRQDSLVWSKVFYILGISHRFSSHITDDGSSYAVCGQTLRCFSDDEIMKMLSGTVFLDGVSVSILLERGFGEYIGIDSAKRCELSDVAYSYEEVAEDDQNVFGISRPRMCAQRCSDWVFEFSTLADTQIQTHIYKYDHQKLFPGMTLFENKLGGKIISLAYPLVEDKSQFFMAFFNIVRKKLLHNLLVLESDPQAVMIANHPMNIYCVKCGDRTLVGCFNVIADETDEIEILVPSSLLTGADISILQKNGEWLTVVVEKRQINEKYCQITLKEKCQYLDGVFILI